MKQLLVICCIMFVTDVIGQTVVVNPDGTHSISTGNIAVNPDGTHSVVVNPNIGPSVRIGNSNIALNPDGTHSIIVGNVAVHPNGTYSIVIDPNETLSPVTGSSGIKIAVNLYGNHFAVTFNGSGHVKSRQKEKENLSKNLNQNEKRSFFKKILRKRKQSTKDAGR